MTASKYEFHWTNGTMDDARVFDNDAAAWDEADTVQIAKDAELQKEIDELDEAIRNEESQSMRLDLERELRDLQSDYEYAPAIDYILKTNADGETERLER